MVIVVILFNLKSLSIPISLKFVLILHIMGRHDIGVESGVLKIRRPKVVPSPFAVTVQ